ncbi:hypothetical protein ACHWQZ_G004494 [Mnemiopsis leidyi]
MIKLLDQRVDPLSFMNNVEKRWQMSQLASIPENSDPFYSLTDSCPQTPPATFTSTDALPSIFTPGATKRRKYSVDPHIKILANQLIPPSTKPTRVQELGKSIKDVWQRRFTPKRVLNELYMPGVLYATRARFVRTEQDYWAVSQGALNSKVYLRRDSHMSAASSSKTSFTKTRSVDGAPEKIKTKSNQEPVLRGHSNTAFDDNPGSFGGPSKDEGTVKHDKKRKIAPKNAKKFQISPGKTLQTFERRKTRPEDSMYESIDPPVLNKTKLSKAFCDS